MSFFSSTLQLVLVLGLLVMFTACTADKGTKDKDRSTASRLDR